ncbi:MAG: YkgJ family cysteine cluster protein [Myxococcota bacterium]|nr:YkgJ family cysteine cluster protein [Myxococcota bacterium]
MSLQNYRTFLNQADTHFEQVKHKFRSQFKCANGCHACCQSGLTVSSIERENIKAFLLANPVVLTQVRSSKAIEDKCEFLGEDGACLIYSARPFVCRSHGAPIAIAEEDYYRIDVCDLNFQSLDIADLPPEEFFLLDDWNLCLSSYGSAIRFPLTPSGILEGEQAFEPSIE